MKTWHMPPKGELEGTISTASKQDLSAQSLLRKKKRNSKDYG
jgi:hypothetical protein